MRANLHAIGKVLIMLAALLVLASAALAQSAQGYELSWWTVDNGGHTSSAGGSYTLGGAIGQPDAGRSTGESATSPYSLAGGFWQGSSVVTLRTIYLPVVLRNHQET